MDVFILEVQNKLHSPLTTKTHSNRGILTLPDVQGFMQYMWNSIPSQEMHEYTSAEAILHLLANILCDCVIQEKQRTSMCIIAFHINKLSSTPIKNETLKMLPPPFECAIY